MKKAVSEVIAAVLLISIALVIAAIIFTFSKGIIEKQKAGSQSSNPYYDADLLILTDLASLPPFGSGAADKIALGVKRLDNEKDVLGVRFIFENDKGDSFSYDTYTNPPNEAGIVKEYDIYPENIGAADFSGIKKVSVSLLYAEDKATKILDEKSFE